MTQKKKRIGEMLIEGGAIDEYQLKAALNRQERWGKKLGETLIEMGFITEDILLKTLSKILNIPNIQIEKYDIKKEILKLVPRKICVDNLVIPLAIKPINGKDRLIVAMADPTNYHAVDEIQFKSGLKVLPMVTTISSIKSAIGKYYPPSPGEKDEISFIKEKAKSMEVVRGGNEDVVEMEESYKEVPNGPIKSKPGMELGGSPEDKVDGLERVSISSFGKAIDDRLKKMDAEESQTTPKPFAQEEYEESTGVFRDDNVFMNLVKILKGKSVISDDELKSLLGVASKTGIKDMKNFPGFKVLIELLHKKKMITDAEKKILEGE